jgi:predicted SprT family Zn-dependent metalloprotease
MAESGKEEISRFSELEYKRKWLHQLQKEFRQICSWYKVSLAAPAFRISDSLATFGSWNPETRTISIASALINEYSWDVVINVLKHEMAHQYVHEYLLRGRETPHGPAFKEACAKLGVMFPFNTATGNTPKVFSAGNDHNYDLEYERKVNKVRKMLSLAGSCNEHEAAAAMSKANSFIRKYNLERLESIDTSYYNYEIINPGKKRLHVIERRIASLLMDYFYVDIVYSELFDPGSLETYKTIEMLGAQENVAFASYVYEFLRYRSDLLWQNYRKNTRAAGKLRKTYILGLLQGFREKLEKEEKKGTLPAEITEGAKTYKTISALVVAKDPGLTDFMSRRFPRLRKVQYRASGIYCADTYTAGKVEGRKITIHKAMTRTDGNRGRLLGN